MKRKGAFSEWPSMHSMVRKEFRPSFKPVKDPYRAPKKLFYIDCNGFLTYYKSEFIDVLATTEGKEFVPWRSVLMLDEYLLPDIKNIVLEYILEKQNWNNANQIMISKQPIFIHDMTYRIAENNWCCDYKFTTESWREATKANLLPVLKYLNFHETPGCNQVLIVMAARRGYDEIVKFLHTEQGLECTNRVIEAAVISENTRLIKYVCRNRSGKSTGKASEIAARKNWLDVLWIMDTLLADSRQVCSYKAMDIAAEIGNYTLFTHLAQTRTEGCSNKAAILAKKNGHKDICEYIKEHPKVVKVFKK